MAVSNYDDVVNQLRSFGLMLTDGLRVGTPKAQRCRVEGGDREARGWYWLHEVSGRHGDLLLVGTYGIWHGNDPGTQKITLDRKAFNDEQLESIKARFREDQRRLKAARDIEARTAAQVAARAWATFAATEGHSEYLIKKGVGAHGVRFSPSGSLVIPICDANAVIQGLQVIRSPGGKGYRPERSKEYWPRGLAKKGHFHLIGIPQWIVLVAEGYATAASLHEATGLPVAVAFDANNIGPVCGVLAKRYKRAKILICADDDSFGTCPPREGGCGARIVIELHPEHCPECGKEHKRSNAGVLAASTAAMQVSGGWMRPRFADEDGRRVKFDKSGAKLTDFNDLHVLEGLHVVRTQVEARLSELGWTASSTAARGLAPKGGGESADMRPVASVDVLLERYALVYGHGGTVFDAEEHLLMQLSDMRDACLTRELHRAWSEHPDKRIVRIAEVGFDPTERDGRIRCNLWGGWPSTAKSGRCERLLELLRHMCAGESKAEQLYRWILCWCAYPIQHPGAKVRSTIVIHGKQGTGKSLFFESYRQIYGEYGSVIGQHALEDKHNDWASKRLFLIADEVVARADLFHVKNTLKSFITGNEVRINPKHLRAYSETNHCNIVFLSNEEMPVVLEEDDRRHAVLWTPEKLEKAFYNGVQREIEEGGIAALHDYLLHYDLGDWHPFLEPPMSDAKATLINLSLDSTSRFFHELNAGDIGDIKPQPALATDVYALYREWCHRTGLRPAPQNKLLNILARRHGVPIERKRYADGAVLRGPHSVVLFGAQRAAAPGSSDSAWLGDQVAVFQTALGDYQGTKRGH